MSTVTNHRDSRPPAQDPVHDWLDALDRQRRALKMPLDVVAEQSGVSRATVCRVLVEKNTSARIENVMAIAGVLGATFEIHVQEPEKLVEWYVQEQAKQLVQMVQGTMALESQGITDQNHLNELVDVAAAEIRNKPRKKMWARKCRSRSRSQAKRPLLTSPS